MSAEVEFFHDRVSRYLIEGVAVRVLEVDVRDTAREAAARQGANQLATCALTQALVSVALLGGHIKGDERLSFQCIGRGNLGSIMADLNADGDLRVRVQYPDATAPGATLPEQLVAALGQGHLYVIKSTPERELYRGTSPFSHSDIAGALEVYFEVSEQVASLVWISVGFEGETLHRARGILLQSLGGGDRAKFEQFSATLDRAAIMAALDAGDDAASLLNRLYPDSSIQEVEASPLRFRCTCSEQKVASILLAMGEAELEDMLEKDGKAEVTCDFCRTVYLLGAEELRGLLKLLRGFTSGSTSS